MWSEISRLATRALAFLGPREEQKTRIETREELIFAPGWAEQRFKESGGNGTSSANPVLDVLTKRQTCAAGYWYCSNLGGCCPTTHRCCGYGYCLPPGRVCCPGGSCDSGWNCCATGTCYPIGGQCCNNGRYCDPGNICVLFDGRNVCCTDLRCTAHVVGTTTVRLTTIAPPTPTATITRARLQWYTYTVYWTYRYYYWYYVAATTASVVTYSSSTTTTTVEVYASDAAEATSSLRAITATMFTTPAEATSLRDLFGVTSTGSSTTRRPTSTGSGGGGSGGGPGGATSGTSLDLPAVCFMVGGLLVGIMAVLL